MIANICSFERMKAAINDFQPFKAPGRDGLYPVLLQKGWNQLKGYYCVNFQACLRHSYEPLAWKEGIHIFLPKPRKESYFEAKSFHMIKGVCRKFFRGPTRIDPELTTKNGRIFEIWEV